MDKISFHNNLDLTWNFTKKNASEKSSKALNDLRDILFSVMDHNTKFFILSAGISSLISLFSL